MSKLRTTSRPPGSLSTSRGFLSPKAAPPHEPAIKLGLCVETSWVARLINHAPRKHSEISDVVFQGDGDGIRVHEFPISPVNIGVAASPERRILVASPRHAHSLAVTTGGACFTVVAMTGFAFRAARPVQCNSIARGSLKSCRELRRDISSKYFSEKRRPRGHAFAEVAPGACFALMIATKFKLIAGLYR